MGLDQYLYSKQYVKNWDHYLPDQLHHITIQKADGPVETINPTYLITEVGYWRKDNQIHKWFVDNCQGGEDDGGTHYVSREKLQELLDTINKVLASSVLVAAKGSPTGPDGLPLPDAEQILADQTVAQDLLPTQSGFFFGGLEYDQWYVQGLKNTVTIITAALALGEDYDFEYYASW